MITFKDVLKESDEKALKMEVPTGSDQWSVTTSDTEKLEYFVGKLIDQCFEIFPKLRIADKVAYQDFCVAMSNAWKVEAEDAPSRQQDMKENAADRDIEANDFK